MKLLMIDNYDSFTYNLVQYFGELGAEVKVVRNNALTLEAIERLAPERIVISPGPCTPTEAGISLAAIGRFAGKIPILGVCLGHQAIGQAFGGKVVKAQRVMHGKVSSVRHDGKGVFAGLPDGFTATRVYRGVTYNITVENPKHVSRGVANVTVDGKQIEGSLIRAEGDSREVHVTVVMG